MLPEIPLPSPRTRMTLKRHERGEEVVTVPKSFEEDDNIVETDLDTNNEGYSEIALTTLTAELARLGFVMVILCKSNHW